MQNSNSITSNIFREWLLRELIAAYREARLGGKRKTVNAHNFEMNDLENIINLRNAILARRYKPSRGVAFIIHDPVQREIFAAPFVDRVVHHFLFKHTAPWWENRFWRGAYSCRKGKGTQYGVFDLQKNMRRVSHDGAIETIVVKRDLQGYFMSLNHDLLYQRILWGLKRQFPDGGQLYRTLKYLWKETIFDNPTKNVTIRGNTSDWDGLPSNKSLFYQPENLGIVIGNLTSQLLSNIFLDQLDRFIVHELKYKNYGRYVDDFYIVIPKSNLNKLLEEDMPKINIFLSKIGLTMHPKKKTETPIKDGVDFLGAKVYLDHIIPGERVRHNIADKLYKFVTNGYGEPQSFGAYDGLLSHYQSEKMLRRLMTGLGQDYRNKADRIAFKKTRRGKSGGPEQRNRNTET